jgi:LmbE family N-acetylglucosaminyl deacetylase
MGNVLKRLKTGLHNKWWLLNYRWRGLQIKIQFYWLLQRCSQQLDGRQKLIVFAPHQDDEVLGCGGIIAMRRQQGVPVKVVFVTDGGAFHRVISRAEIVEIRKQEALTALNILGVDSDDIHFLNRPDGALSKMTQAERQQTIAEMAELLRNFQPQEVYVTHRNDRSKDHEITYQLVKEAISQTGVNVDLWQYAIWLLWKSLLWRDLQFTELAGAYRVSIHSVQSQKKQAIETYRSQYLPMDAESGAILPPEFLWRFFLPYEVFFKTELSTEVKGELKIED